MRRLAGLAPYLAVQDDLLVPELSGADALQDMAGIVQVGLLQQHAQLVAQVAQALRWRALLRHPISCSLGTLPGRHTALTGACQQAL